MFGARIIIQEDKLLDVKDGPIAFILSDDSKLQVIINQAENIVVIADESTSKVDITKLLRKLNKEYKKKKGKK